MVFVNLFCVGCKWRN